jgi:hypothetical protein
MRRILLLTLAGLLCLAPLTARADDLRADEQRMAIVQNWCRKFLGRDGSLDELRVWTKALRDNANPEPVLAEFLNGPEYYDRCGGTPEGFVQTLFNDLIGRQPPAQDYDELVRRATVQERSKVVRIVLQRYPWAMRSAMRIDERPYRP